MKAERAFFAILFHVFCFPPCVSLKSDKSPSCSVILKLKNGREETKDALPKSTIEIREASRDLIANIAERSCPTARITWPSSADR